jgi:hypothetical protein
LEVCGAVEGCLFSFSSPHTPRRAFASIHYNGDESRPVGQASARVTSVL